MLYDYSSENATSSEQCSNNDCPEALVTSNPISGAQVNFPTYVALTSNVEGAVIRYTIDGTVPDTLSQIYTEPILIASAGVILRAIAHSTGCPAGDEPVMTAQFSNASFPFVFSYACDTPDHAGQLNDFTPNGTADHHWELQFELAGATTIKRLELYQLDALGDWTTGQVWSTDSPIQPAELGDPFDVFPLLIFIAAVQQHASYQSSLGSFGAGSHTWDLYGDTLVPASGLFRLDIILGDDTKLSQTIDATCTGTPPLCPPPAPPVLTPGCGQITVDFTGTVGSPYEIWISSSIAGCGDGTWQLVEDGTIDASPKSVTVTGLTPECLYSFYVVVQEPGCTPLASSIASMAVLPEPEVSITSDKLSPAPGEDFTISWSSNHIGGAVCGSCLDGEVTINQSIGCKPGNTSGSKVENKGVCGLYTYQITGCNVCGSAVASVQVDVRCECLSCNPAAIPAKITFPNPTTFLSGFFEVPSPTSCSPNVYVFTTAWNGEVFKVAGACDYGGLETDYVGGDTHPTGSYAVLSIRVQFVVSKWIMTILCQTNASDTVWVGEKAQGCSPVGTYVKTGGCCSGPATITVT